MKRTFLILLSILSLALSAQGRQPQQGYRGFLEWSNNMHSETFGYLGNHGNIYLYRENCFFTGVSTTHGYQINPYFFIGGGLDLEYCHKSEHWLAALYLNSRYDMHLGNFTPYADVRLGASLTEGAGVYFSPTIGYRFNWGRKVGLNLGLGLTLAGYKTEHFEGTGTDEGGYQIQYTGTKNHVRANFSFRAGIDF